MNKGPSMVMRSTILTDPLALWPLGPNPVALGMTSPISGAARAFPFMRGFLPPKCLCFFGSENFVLVGMLVHNLTGDLQEVPMCARLTTAIRIGDAARAILRKTKTFPTEGFGEGADAYDYEHIGVEPILLALAMELALKAWLVFDTDDPKVPRTHDLMALFKRLNPESQEKLDAEFKRSVAPFHPNGFFVDYGIRDILFQHKDAFVDWRY